MVILGIWVIMWYIFEFDCWSEDFNFVMYTGEFTRLWSGVLIYRHKLFVFCCENVCYWACSIATHLLFEWSFTKFYETPAWTVNFGSPKLKSVTSWAKRTVTAVILHYDADLCWFFFFGRGWVMQVMCIFIVFGRLLLVFLVLSSDWFIM